MTEVRVAIYKAPSILDLAHWAIEVRKEDVYRVYEIVGYATNFRFTYSDRMADNSTRFYVYVPIAKDLESIEAVHESMCNTIVDNDDEHFNCQLWVLKALRTMNKAGLISQNDCNSAEPRLQSVLDIVGIPICLCDSNLCRLWK